MDISPLVTELEAIGVKKQSPYPVWEIKSNLTLAKASILKSVLSLEKTCYLNYSEDPSEWGIQGDWQQTPDGVWILPHSVSALALVENFLYLGNWSLYVCDRPIAPSTFPNVFRSKPEEITEYMDRNSLGLLIGSFHDNDPWIVAMSSAIIKSAL